MELQGGARDFREIQGPRNSNDERSMNLCFFPNCDSCLLTSLADSNDSKFVPIIMLIMSDGRFVSVRTGVDDAIRTLRAHTFSKKEDNLKT